ncbi:class I ribonucleotide reductase maintenance protein YfaE [Alteromonas gilva]|uniref:class I ribonucleotide reductase maintenance protein YfaE n=1 Tax=Alteromonas gilva TaxID=2987522 RepID=UPI0035AB73CD
MITVHTAGVQHLIPVAGSLLESLEKSSVPVESHCRSGFCGACRVKVKKGSVEYFDTPLGFCDDDEVLPCVCKPSNKLEIEVR